MGISAGRQILPINLCRLAADSAPSPKSKKKRSYSIFFILVNVPLGLTRESVFNGAILESAAIDRGTL
jgi:hypothetical protein